MQVLEYYSALWCPTADMHLKLLNRAVSGAPFLTGGVFECDIAHRRSVPVLCMLYEIRCNPVHHLNGALPRPYVPVRVTRDALVTHLYSYALPRCRTSQYRRTFYSTLSVPLDRSCKPCILWCVNIRFQEQGQCFLIGLSCSLTTIVLYYFYLSFLFFMINCGAGVFGLIGCNAPTLSLALPTFFNNNNNN